MEVANTLAYYDVAKVMAVRCFIVRLVRFENTAWEHA